MGGMERVEVLVLPQVSDHMLERIQNVDRRVKVVDARGWFDIELRATWPQWTVDRYLAARKYPATSLEERNRALRADRAHGLATAEGFKGTRAALEMGS